MTEETEKSSLDELFKDRYTEKDERYQKMAETGFEKVIVVHPWDPRRFNNNRGGRGGRGGWRGGYQNRDGGNQNNWRGGGGGYRGGGGNWRGGSGGGGWRGGSSGGGGGGWRGGEGNDKNLCTIRDHFNPPKRGKNN
ncbi:hypothetical protein CAEBREN_11586 [Caenorhabditis brenneri]|uniref:Uncharacterized protein n=1 Tax=Caenorhabditis brenneri TaxID=135651 RepID=G0NVG2_CAEBE|nr:hypothetical protein CAEBREN_11586 [Caenorhabditis brenneri]